MYLFLYYLEVCNLAIERIYLISLTSAWHLLISLYFRVCNNNNDSRIYRAQNCYKSSNVLKSKKGQSRDRHGSTSKKRPPGYNYGWGGGGGGGGVCQPKQVSLQLASETIYCLLRSNSMWQLFLFSWCKYCKATNAYVLLQAD